MLDRIREKLKALDCEAWELAETIEEGWEFYFIRHRLDQNRMTAVKTIDVKVFRKSEDGKYLGSAEGEIPPTADDPEVDRILSDLRYQAGLVWNPAYTLNGPLPPQAEMPAPDPEQIAGEFIRAIKQVPESEDADINSYEIFVRSRSRHYQNSCGADVCCRWPSSMAEVVVNARQDDHEIEVYRNFRSGTCDGKKLTEDAARALQTGKDRLKAEPMPKPGDIPVLFSSEDAVRIYDYFIDRMNAEYRYRKLSTWEEGRPVDGEMTGDRVSVEAAAMLPNSSRNVPVDDEGAAIRDRFLIRDGVAEHFWGSRQFSQYLGLKDSSLIYNARVSGGSRTEEELRCGDYLELVEFSDFQVDPIGGDIAGEIRLGYLHRGGEVRIVTGGSVSGSMTEALKTMRMSRETVQYDTREIPKVTLLQGLRITGVAES